MEVSGFLYCLLSCCFLVEKKIPELMRGLGKGIREFNDAKDNVKRELEDGINEKDAKKTTTTTTVQP